jgi:dihydrofolate reductase
MSKLIVTEFVTMDGVMEAPGGEGPHPHAGWTMDHENEGQWYGLDEMLALDTLLIGRVTYESFAGAWPNYEGDFADAMNSVAKVVVSSTLTDPEWNNTSVLTGDVVAGVTELKAKATGPILVGGSATLVHTLLSNDLVDELRLVVYPVTVGGGVRVFPEDGRKTVWTLADSVSYASGIRVDIYQR